MQKYIENVYNKREVEKFQAYMMINRKATQTQKEEQKEIQKRNLKKMKNDIKESKKATMNKNID